MSSWEKRVDWIPEYPVSGLRGAEILQLGLLETEDFPFSLDDDGSSDEIRIFHHQPDRLGFGRRRGVHSSLPEENRGRIQEFADVSGTDQVRELISIQRISDQVPDIEIQTHILENHFGFAAKSTSRFLVKPDPPAGHGNPPPVSDTALPGQFIPRPVPHARLLSGAESW